MDYKTLALLVPLGISSISPAFAQEHYVDYAMGHVHNAAETNAEQELSLEDMCDRIRYIHAYLANDIFNIFFSSILSDNGSRVSSDEKMQLTESILSGRELVTRNEEPRVYLQDEYGVFVGFIEQEKNTHAYYYPIKPNEDAEIARKYGTYLKDPKLMEDHSSEIEGYYNSIDFRLILQRAGMDKLLELERQKPKFKKPSSPKLNKRIS